MRSEPMSERTPRSESDSERPVRPRGTAKDRALRLLGVRDRSRRELEVRLLRAGFEPPDVERALEDLAGAGLIDDDRLASQVVAHAQRGPPARHRGPTSPPPREGRDR